MRSTATCGRLSEALTSPLLAVGGLPENPTLSTKKEKIGGGGNSKNDSRGGFSGWTRASFAGTGVGAELTSFARNRFELWRKMPPRFVVFVKIAHIRAIFSAFTALYLVYPLHIAWI